MHTLHGLADIESLQPGDIVLTYNEAAKQQEYKPVLHTYQRYTQQLRAMELGNGEMLYVTPEHRFYNDAD